MTAAQDPEEFSSAYLLVLNKLWESDVEIDRLRADPVRYAIEAGLPVAAGARVVVDESAMDGLFTSTQLFEDWTRVRGMHVLHVPPAPVFEVAELSDYELDTVSGGHNIACYVDPSTPIKPT